MRRRRPDADARRPPGLGAGRRRCRSAPPAAAPCRSSTRRCRRAIRSAVMLPRNVQQAYSGLSERDSSHEATGTSARPSWMTGGALSRTDSCSSGRCFHSCLPVARVEGVEPAGQVAEQQDVSAVHRGGDDRRSDRAGRLIRPLQAAAVGAQRVDRRRRRCRRTPGRRSPSAAPNAEMSPSKPNAHFSFSRGTSLADEPGQRRRHEAGVVASGAPAVPGGSDVAVSCTVRSAQ